MITTPEEYLAKLHLIQNNNFPTTAILLPSDETIYNIDLNQRTIESPEFLSVATDHYAETIYFRVARYFDNMDLTNTVCLIQYENANAVNEDGEPAGGFCYLVPFYDIEHFKETDEILFPWAIGGPATAAAGKITFSVRFYRVSADGEELVYNLNTKPAVSKILHGMNVITKDNENFVLADTTVEMIYQEIDMIRSGAILTWVDAF
jgi:hypothetical protein